MTQNAPTPRAMHRAVAPTSRRRRRIARRGRPAGFREHVPQDPNRLLTRPRGLRQFAVGHARHALSRLHFPYTTPHLRRHPSIGHTSQPSNRSAQRYLEVREVYLRYSLRHRRARAARKLSLDCTTPTDAHHLLSARRIRARRAERARRGKRRTLQPTLHGTNSRGRRRVAWSAADYTAALDPRRELQGRRLPSPDCSPAAAPSARRSSRR